MEVDIRNISSKIEGDGDPEKQTRVYFFKREQVPMLDAPVPDATTTKEHALMGKYSLEKNEASVINKTGTMGENSTEQATETITVADFFKKGEDLISEK